MHRLSTAFLMRKPRKKSSGSVQKLDGDRVVEALVPSAFSTDLLRRRSYTDQG